MIPLGLRIDVDTFRGTRDGVPTLLNLLKKHHILATFYFSVGPDNMGRHLWRLLRPSFFIKMLRTNAASLYGWDILLRGTFWPGPRIGEKLGDVIAACAEKGHEIGFHAWDHQYWQKHIATMTARHIREYREKGMSLLSRIIGASPSSSAVPGWRANALSLKLNEELDVTFCSDCRGYSLFQPKIGDQQLTHLQIPVTLPTYDELVGRDGVTAQSFYQQILENIDVKILNVFTIHAEVEGIASASLFSHFLDAAAHKKIRCVPLSELINHYPMTKGEIEWKPVHGREGWCAQQL